MARPLRIELVGGLYHVTSRGDGREAIYIDDVDRKYWLALLRQVCERFNWVCHAYCLMDNHYHIVVETIEGNLSKGMRQLNGVYTQHFNRTHQRVGHVFQGRYKGILVERESHLLELARYVVLNPVRAGMASEVDEWPWSSYRATVGDIHAPDWLQVSWILGQFSKQKKRAAKKYQAFVREGVGLPSIWADLKQQIYLGGDAFVAKMQHSAKLTTDISEIPRVQRRAKAKPLSYYAEFESKREGMAVAYQTGDYSMKAIADFFGVHYATVSRAVKLRGN